MITKDNLLKNFNNDEFDDVIKVYESMKLSYFRDIPIFTKFFCTPNIWSYFAKNFSSKDFPVDACGGVNEGDRRIVAFNNKYNLTFPYKILKVESTSKFTKVTHRDYLGSLMSLGINREKLGDLRVDGNYAIVAVYDEIVEYIIGNLTSVRNSPVNVSVMDESEFTEVKFCELLIIVSSLRVDAIVSKLANISRVSAIELINSNKVLLDYSRVKEKSEDINIWQRITIVGIGKFLVGDIVGTTKSGKFRINIKKYI